MTGLAIFQHVIVWLPMLIAGIFLMRWAWRGRRINDHPICRKCRFDLVGLAPDGSRPDRCPECGTDLAGNTRRARRAVIDGERKRRWRAFTLGLLLLLAALGTGFWLTYKPLAKFPWTTWAPDWVLAEMIDSPNTARSDLAVRELMRRITLGEAGQRGVSRAVEAALRAQADLAKPWNAELGNMIEVGREHGLVSQEQWTRYARHAVVIDLRVRNHVAAGSHIPYKVSHTYRVGSRETLLQTGPGEMTSHPPIGVRLSDAGAIVNQVEPEYPVSSAMTAWGIRVSAGMTGAMSGGAYARNLQPGTCSIELRFDVTVFAPDFDDARTGEIDASTILATWRHSESFQVTVAPKGEDVVRTVSDPSLAQTLRDSLRPIEFRSDTSDNNLPTISGTIDIRSPPVAGAFNVAARVKRADGSIEDVQMMEMSFRAGASTRYRLFGAVSRAAAPPVSLDLVLTPSPATAARTVDLTEIWGEEILLENVPITLEEE